MATWEDVRRLVAALPETDEHASYGGQPSWRVRGKGFVWDRPLRAADRTALVGADELAELVEEAWRVRAPRRLVAEHDAGR